SALRGCCPIALGTAAEHKAASRARHMVLSLQVRVVPPGYPNPRWRRCSPLPSPKRPWQTPDMPPPCRKPTATPRLPKVPNNRILRTPPDSHSDAAGRGCAHARLRPLRPVALKMILHPECAGAEERQRFQAEAEAVARLQHPNIVQVHKVGEHNGQPY